MKSTWAHSKPNFNHNHNESEEIDMSFQRSNSSNARNSTNQNSQPTFPRPPQYPPNKQNQRESSGELEGRWAWWVGGKWFSITKNCPPEIFFAILNFTISSTLRPDSSLMASSLSSKPFFGSSRIEGFSGLSSLSSDLSKLSFSAVKISVGSGSAKKLRKFAFIYFSVTFSVMSLRIASSVYVSFFGFSRVWFCSSVFAVPFVLGCDAGFVY